MEERKLTNEQMLCIAALFLKCFGLLVEIKNNVSDDEILHILNTRCEQVGTVTLLGGKVIMHAQTELGQLNASFDRIIAEGYFESTAPGYLELFNWAANVKFSIIGNDNEKFIGKFDIDCLNDQELGNRCILYPYIEQYVDEKKVMTIGFQGKENSFNLELLANGLKESIEFTPYSDSEQYVIHSIESETGDDFSKVSRIEKENDNLHSWLRYIHSIYKNSVHIMYGSSEVEKSDNDIIQVGNLIKSNDPSIYARIAEAREKLVIGDSSLFDAFLVNSLYRLSIEEILALFNIGIKPDAKKGAAEALNQLNFGSNYQLKAEQ